MADQENAEPAIEEAAIEDRVTAQAVKLYDRVFVEIFQRKYVPAATELPYTLEEVRQVEKDLNVKVGNLPDIAYAYRTGRYAIPEEILATGNWVIEGTGKGRYKFVRLLRAPYINIPDDLYTIEIPEATPDIVLKHTGNDEQAVLSKVRYNRLLDIFLSLTAYHLQGHFRSTVKEIGQVEIDELYVGVDTEGRGYAIPIEAKSVGGRERLGVVQIRQMILFAQQKFAGLILKPVGIKPFVDGSIAFVEFDDQADLEAISVRRYARYKLVRDDH
ncbi:MAG: endonuclease [Blastocatellia bacterium]